MSQPSVSSPPEKKWVVGTLTYTKAGLVVLFFWLLFGDFALQLKERSDTTTAQIVLKKFAASDLLVGLIIGSIPAAIGMLVGPIICVKSDRTRTRLGRRIPYLLIPLPAVVLSMGGLAMTPTVGGMLHEWLGPDSPGLQTCILAAFTMFWVIFEFSSAIINAIFGGFINDVVPQAVIGRFFGFFRMISLLAGVVFNSLIIKHAEENFFWIFIGTGLLYGVGFSLMCFMVKEGKYPDPPPKDPATSSSHMQGIRTYFRECYANPYYLSVFVALVLCMLSFAPVNSFSIFFAKSVGMSIETYGKFRAASYVISFVLAYFLGSLADRFHPLRLGIVLIACYAAVTLWGSFAATTPFIFGIAFVAHTILSGAYMTATASIGQRLYPRMKFGQFASAAGLIYAVSFMLLPPLVGFALDRSGNNYRLTFLAAGCLACLGLVALLRVYTQFMKFGGPKNYVAPGSG